MDTTNMEDAATRILNALEKLAPEAAEQILSWDFTIALTFFALTVLCCLAGVVVLIYGMNLRKKAIEDHNSSGKSEEERESGPDTEVASVVAIAGGVIGLIGLVESVCNLYTMIGIKVAPYRHLLEYLSNL